MAYQDQINETAKSLFRLSKDDQLFALTELLKGYDAAFKQAHPEVKWSENYPFWGIGTEINIKK